MPHIPVKSSRAPIMCANKVTEVSNTDIVQILNGLRQGSRRDVHI